MSEICPSSAKYWEDRYQERDTGWDRGVVHPALDKWLSQKSLSREDQRPSRILIPGCGNGYEVIKLASAGYDVTAIDLAATPLNSLQQKLDEAELTATLVKHDLFDFCSNEPFDAVYEQTCLCAIEPRSRKKYEKKIHELLKPNGKLFALFMQCEDIIQGPPFHCDMEEMRSLFAPKRWIWESSENDRYDHPNAPLYELAFSISKSKSGLSP